jgi:signal transduction histidine kinase
MRGEWAAAYDDLPDGVLVADAGGRVVSLNVSGARLLGLDAADARGQDYREVLPLVDAAGRDWWSCTDPYGGLHIRTGQPERLLDLVAGPRKGHGLLVSARYVRDARGGRRLARLVVSFRGVGSRERADREQANLVSTVAHEIRSPLTTVKGFTATLLAKWDRFTDDQRRTMLAAINADADRVTRLLSDLLDASRIDAGRLVVRRREVDLAPLVGALVARHADQHPDRGFDLLVAGPLPTMWLDPDKVTQIVGNLLENAVKHGGGRIHLELTPAADVGGEPGARLVVADEGEGISPEGRARIFGRFWQAGSQRTGTGLGLYIVKGLVHAHGGSIELADEPGGASFVVRLPAGRPPYEG